MDWQIWLAQFILLSIISYKWGKQEDEKEERLLDAIRQTKRP